MQFIPNELKMALKIAKKKKKIYFLKDGPSKHNRPHHFIRAHFERGRGDATEQSVKYKHQHFRFLKKELSISNL